MKAIGKFLLLFIIVAAVIFILWQAAQKVLFDDNEHASVNQDSNIPAQTSPKITTPAPKELSAEEAFESTSDDSAPDTGSSPALSCQQAGDVVGHIYDMYKEGESTDTINDYISSNKAIPDDNVDMMLSFVKSFTQKVQNKDQLPERRRFIQNFVSLCQQEEQQMSH
ncbi:hypothetical protein [Brackiella oedipodis]|uniref:hypothetical protein n=1 Tax=Brackiella oedipodis TaxID=124225 RepID=UPI0006880059|nr:hypothetical protein [Brackiella oedipodis]